MDKKILNSMFDNLLHIGNKTNYWSPKMKGYIYGQVNGIHVFNLIKTAKKLEEVKAEIKALHASGKKILFVATKLQARDTFSKVAEETGHFYVNEKWVPGLLTNFKTIKRRISTYLKLLKDSKNGSFDVLTKKEAASKLLELEKLDRAFKGVKEMKKVPDVIFAIDGIFEAQAIREANSLNLKAFAVLNTNGDDTLVENCIPANTNSVKSIDFIANEIISTLKNVKVAIQRAPAKMPTGNKRPDNKSTPKAPATKSTEKAPAPKTAAVKTEAKPAVVKTEAKPAAVKTAPAKKAAVKTESKKTEEK